MKLNFLIIFTFKFTEVILDSNPMNMQASRMMASILSKSTTENPNCSLNDSTSNTEQIEDVVSTNFNKSAHLQLNTFKNQVIAHNLTKKSVENKENFSKITVDNQKLNNNTEDLIHIRVR